MVSLHLHADQVIATAILAVIFILPLLVASFVRLLWGVAASRRTWFAALTWFYLVVFVLASLMAILGSVLMPGFFLLGVPFVAAVLVATWTTRMAAGVSTAASQPSDDDSR